MKKVISLILLYIFSINQVSAWIFLYKIMPNTTDDKNLEYIEIYNSNTEKISLEWYTLKDKSNKSFDFWYWEYIESNSSKKYFRSKTSIILNNTNEELYFYDNNSVLIDSYSYSSSTKSEAILIHNTNTNSWATTNSWTTSSWSLENIELIYEFQNPSYLIDKTINLEKYICDKEKDECKINLNLENSFNWSINKNDYICLIDFGLKWWTTWQEDSCNPSTITFPKWIFNIKMKITSKADSNIFSEKSFILENSPGSEIIEIETEKIIYKEKSCSSNSASTSSSVSNTNNSSYWTNSKININNPIIQIQSWISAWKCNKTDCSVNLIYKPKNKNEMCLWDFWGWNFKSNNTDKKCNPWYVKYWLWNHKISLKVFDKNNLSNYKISYLNFENKAPHSVSTKEKEEATKISEIDKYKNKIIDENSPITPFLKGDELQDKKLDVDKIVDIVDKKEIKPKIKLPYFMDNYENNKNIILQWRLWNKTLSWSTITCIDKCSLNFTAKDNQNIVEYLWDFWNWEKFSWQNPSYIKYKTFWKYNISLVTLDKNWVRNIENFEVIYKQKPVIIKTKKKKISKKKYKKKKAKTTSKKDPWVYMTKEKLNSNYVPKKEINKNYVEKSSIAKYCSNIDYFPEAINKFKILVSFLILMLVIVMWFAVLKKRELL